MRYIIGEVDGLKKLLYKYFRRGQNYVYELHLWCGLEESHSQSISTDINESLCLSSNLAYGVFDPVILSNTLLLWYP